MSDIAGLIARLEAATGSLDADTEAQLIAACNGWEPFSYSVHSGDNGAPEILVSNVKGKHVSYNPWPSASIDAALTLVPEKYLAAGVYFAISKIAGFPPATAELYSGVNSIDHIGQGKTAALSICIAALKARTAQS